jgi:hypothetical protein
MVTLTSRILRDSPRVAEAANNKRRPIAFPETGDGVERVQLALINLDFPLPRSTRKTGSPDGIFGGETLSALKAFQRSKALKDDGMAGPDTLERMDQLLGLRRGGGRIEPVPVPETRAAFMTRAFDASRQSLRGVIAILVKLQRDIDGAVALGEPARATAIASITSANARNIEVLVRRLLVSRDVTSAAFRDALRRTIDLLGRNVGMPKSLFDAKQTGVCSPTFQPNIDEGGVPFARTGAGLTPEKTHLCDPFFAQSPPQQRDVITHELFHLFGPEFTDHSVANTDQGLTNPNTLAQIVARLTDRTTQANSDGREADTPPLPAP